MIIGLKRGEVRLVPHQLGWSSAFIDEKARLMNLLGNTIMQVEHIGSTAIARLNAKLIIDIAIGVQSIINQRHPDLAGDIETCRLYLFRRQRFARGRFLCERAGRELNDLPACRSNEWAEMDGVSFFSRNPSCE